MEVTPMAKRWFVPYKKVVLEYAETCGRDADSYREFGVSEQTLYAWRKAYRSEGAAGLIPKKPVAKSHPRQFGQKLPTKASSFERRATLGPRGLPGISRGST